MGGLIYKITNKINGKSYVGLTTQKLSVRFYKHLSSSNCTAISAAIQKYGKNNFEVVAIDSSDSLEELKKKESFYIQTLGTLSPHGYNLTSGGEAPSPSLETREKLSQAFKGKKRSKDARKRIAEGKKGKKTGPCSEGRKKAISEALRGRKLSIEHRQVLSMAKKGRKLPALAIKNRIANISRQILCHQNGKIYDSIIKAARILNLDPSSITRNCKGKQSIVKGYSFEYVKKETTNEQS
jgi:group I intron endonuclease